MLGWRAYDIKELTDGDQSSDRRRGMGTKDIRIFSDLEALSTAAAQEFFRLAEKSIAASEEFRVILTGGSTVVRLYQILSDEPYKTEIPWDKILFFWGDERLVPPDHPESNYGQAMKLLLSYVPIKAENIYRIRGELNPDKAVQEYTDQLRRLAGSSGTWPRFDLVLLGMGSDGHVASIFPGSKMEEGNRLPVLATIGNYEGRPAQRVTLTPFIFNPARQILFLVAGDSKAHAVKEVFSEGSDPKNWPALRIKPMDGRVTWMLDEAAASQLPASIRDLAKAN
jgi:6-phosphogluconolactonase